MLRVLWLIHLMAGIHGTVRSSERGLPVRGAMVQLDGIQVGVTDSLGRYRLTGLTAGAHEFRIVSAGFESQRVGVSLVDGADLALDVSLAAHPVLLPPIETVANRTVVADSTTSAPVNEPGLARFAGGWQRDRPAAATDVNALLASAPGVSTRGDNLGALSIRGGRGSENRMLLDGIPLSSATHFAGASGGLNPDAIGSVDLHGGVASARFDGALAGVVELHTADGTPTAPRITANASVSDLRSLAQLPVGRGSLLLGGRTSFRNLLTDGSGLGTTNGYQDAIAVGRIPLGPGELRLVSFESGNRMHWESSADGLEAGHDDASAPPSGPFGNAAIWRSGAVGATWAGSAHAGGAWRLAGWWNGSSAAIQTASVAGALALTSGISELGLAAEYQRRLDKGTLLLGAEVTRPRSWYRSSSSSANAADAAAGLIITGRPTLGALFGEWGWRASHALDLRLGLRASSNFASQTTLAPRAVLSFHPDGRTSIDAGFGRTHQAVQSLLNEENITSTIVSPMLPAATALNTPMAHADQYALTIARRIGPRTMLSLEGYQRNWHGVVTPAATAAGFFSTTAPAVGDGESRGVNLSLDAAHGPLFVRATAGLASARQEIADGSYHIGTERPWLFSGTAGWIPSARTAIQFAWFSGGGQPTTAMLPGLEWHPFSGATGVGEMEGVASNQAGAINGLRLPARLRLDAGIRHLWTRGPGSTRGITTSLRLENLLNRDEPAGVVALANGSLQLLRGTPRGVVFELGWAY
ncbi:MAG: TonB-dependent receptor [Gemmatimonadales bacterium]